jgi:hypothetical protein
MLVLYVLLRTQIEKLEPPKDGKDRHGFASRKIPPEEPEITVAQAI